MQTDPISPVVLLQDEDENEDEEEEEDPLLHVNLGNKMFQHMFSVSAIVTELMDSFVHSMFTSC
jgi:hypothetical protein